MSGGGAVAAPGARTWRWGLSGLVAGLLVAAAVGVVLAPRGSGLDAAPRDAVSGLLFAAVGVRVSATRRGNRIGWLLLLLGLSSAVSVAAAALAGYGTGWAWVSRWAWWPGYGLVPVLLLLFPHGTLPSRRWRPALAGCVAAVVWTTALLAWAAALAPATFLRSQDGRVDGQLRVLLLAGVVGMAVSAAGLVAGVVALAGRWRQARGEERQQLKWLLYGGAVTTAATGLDIVAGVPGAALVAGVVLPVVTGVAVLRHRLYDIDPIIHRSIVWLGMTGVVVTLHVLTVTLFAAVAGRAGLPAALAGTGVAAVAFSPIRDRLQRAVNRLLYGRRDEPYEVLTQLGRGLSRPQGPQAALDGLARTLAEALKLPHVAVEMPAGTRGFRTAASVGAPVGPPLQLPLLHSGEVVGRLVVSPRSADEPLSPRDRRLLDDVARQAGPAVSAVRLTADLQRSRERLVIAREEERRRLRRDLHDGLGPLLAGQVLHLGVAREQVPPSAPALDRLLDRLGGQAQEALADLRRLVYGLRPPALDDMGLLGALRDAASRWGAGPALRVVATTPLPTLPAAVEVAVYRIAVEAMTNCVRHARASNCEVRLTVGSDVLVEIQDDGAGVRSGYRAGVGLSGMRERTEELGGSLLLTSAPDGGTLVTARLPLQVEPVTVDATAAAPMATERVPEDVAGPVAVWS